MLAPEAARPATADRGSAVLARYTVAASLARLADEGARVALLLQVLDVRRGAAFGGLLVAALMVPHVVVAPLAGGLADGVRRRRVLYAGAFVAYGVSLLGAALLVAPAPVAAFGLVVVAGCCAPLLTAGLTSVLGELAPDRLPRAFGLDATSYSVAGIAGPGLAAVVAGRSRRSRRSPGRAPPPRPLWSPCRSRTGRRGRGPGRWGPYGRWPAGRLCGRSRRPAR